MKLGELTLLGLPLSIVENNNPSIVLVYNPKAKCFYQAFLELSQFY